MQALRCRQRHSMGITYNYRKEVQEGLITSLPNQVTNKCNIRKILRSVITILKLNLFESSLLGWLLKKSKYDAIIQKPQQEENTEENNIDIKVLEFLLLRAYYVKSYISEEKVAIEIETELNSYFPTFHMLYKNWKPQKSLKILSLMEINKIFQSWLSRQQEKKKVDYNHLVEKILYLSKTYNVGGGQQPRQKQQKEVRKKRKPNEKSKQKIEKSSVQIYESRNGNNTNSNPNTFNDPWNQIYPDAGFNQIQELQPVRRSTRYMMKSSPFKDMFESKRPNLLDSKQSQGLFQSIKRTDTFGGLKLKLTTSFDELK